MIIGICGWQGSGKTLTMVAATYELAYSLGPLGYQVVGNVALPRIKHRLLDVQGLRLWVGVMVRQHVSKSIVLIDEIDRVFPARFWGDREQSESLIGLWQDEKLGNYILYTAHRGRPLCHSGGQIQPPS